MHLYLFVVHTWKLHNTEEIAKGSQHAVGANQDLKALSQSNSAEQLIPFNGDGREFFNEK